jgi:hypothetical protein
MWAALCLVRPNLHSGRLRVVLAVVLVAVLVWFCLPASLRTKLWEGWKKIAHAIGNFQARVLLTVIYSILILPFGLVVRFFSDSLHSKKRPEQWFDHPPMPNDLDEARRQG